VNRVFVDTNARLRRPSRLVLPRARARAALARLEQEGAELWISRQVLREYLAAVTRPSPNGTPPMTREEAATAVEGFMSAYNLAEDGSDTLGMLLVLIRRVPMGGKQVHDANLVATMLTNRITRLLTFNVADFRRFATDIELVTP